MENKNLLIALVAILTVLFLGSFGTGGMMGFGWMFMWIPVVVLIIILTALLGKGSTCMSHPMEHEESAIETLNKRYASGEISREEYLRMKGEIEER